MRFVTNTGLVGTIYSGLSIFFTFRRIGELFYGNSLIIQYFNPGYNFAIFWQDSVHGNVDIFVKDFAQTFM